MTTLPNTPPRTHATSESDGQEAISGIGLTTQRIKLSSKNNQSIMHKPKLKRCHRETSTVLEKMGDETW